jgi:threonine/homoserine/homoserine lactone efflux protein
MQIEISFFLRGLIIGFSIAAPVGPIGALCIRHVLAQGWTLGFATGLGAATADVIYGCIAGFGLTAVSNFLINQQIWLRLIGGAFLCYLGIKTFVSRPTQQAVPIQYNTVASTYASTFFLTLTNPITIISFVAIFSGLGATNINGNYFTASLLVLGVFAGSVLWWLLLSSGTSLMRRKFTPRMLKWVNRVSGVVITVFGLLALFNFKSNT